MIMSQKAHITISYYYLFLSHRLSAISSCNMDLKEYPMDKQTCKLVYESCKYIKDFSLTFIYRCYWANLTLYLDIWNFDRNCRFLTRLASVGILGKEREPGVGKLGWHGDLKGILFRYFVQNPVCGFFELFWNSDCFTSLVFSFLFLFLNTDAH